MTCVLPKLYETREETPKTCLFRYILLQKPRRGSLGSTILEHSGGVFSPFSKVLVSLLGWWFVCLICLGVLCLVGWVWGVFWCLFLFGLWIWFWVKLQDQVMLILLTLVLLIALQMLRASPSPHTAELHWSWAEGRSSAWFCSC